MVFKVLARSSDGIARTFTREQASREELLDDLRREHLLVMSVTEVTDEHALPPWWHPAWLMPMTGFEVETGLRQLASMLRSGVTLLQGLKTVEEQADSPRTRRTWRRVGARVFSGSAFAAALAEQRGRFGEIVIRLAEVGERSGELEHAITRAADQMEARRNLRTQVVNALTYPLVAVTMAVGVSVYLVAVVIPKLAEFLKQGGAALPAITQMLMDVSEWINTNGLSLLAGILGVVVAWFVVRVNALGRECEDVFLLRVPITGRILRLSGTALFARSMQIMTESGVTLLDALETAAMLLTNRRYRHRIIDARAAVMRGTSLAEALAPAREFLPMLRRMAAVGEVSGSLPETFGETARFHEMMLAVAIKRFGLLIEPVMICITGGLVGFVYIAFFMALFAIAGTN